MKRAVKTIVEESKRVFDIEDLCKMQLDRIKQMREEGPSAPVDTMGCHKLADPLEKPEVFRFQVLISLMLSSQTKDQVNAAAMARLQDFGLNIDSMLQIENHELEKLLIPVSFYKRKTIYIKETCSILKSQYNNDIPNTLEGLCALPGVGPKMAHLVLQIAWNKIEGIAVDVHVHRIVNRLGWAKTKTPEKTREFLQGKIPRAEWETINPLLVGFGQTVCLPVKPKCSTCLCRNICPSSTAKEKGKSTSALTTLD